MKIVFLPTTAPDFEWITEYYLSAFPEGGPKAYQNLERSLLILADNPRIGEAIAPTRYRKYSVRRTPFCLVYRIEGETLQISHIWDLRSNPLDQLLDDDGTADT